MNLAYIRTFLLVGAAFLILGGCASSSNNPDSDSIQKSEEDETQPAITLADDSTSSSDFSNTPEELQSTDPVDEVSKKQAVKALNQKIQLGSFAESVNKTGNFISRESYKLGPGDVLEIAVFQVEELNRKVRITGDGMIMIPLLGGVNVNGMTTTEVEKFLTFELGKDYLQNPQVSVFVDEFKSQQVAVLGAVDAPNIYEIRQPRTIIEMLAQAGGLTDKAGTQIQIRRSVYNREKQLHENESLIVELDVLLKGNNDLENITLRGGDSVVVPETGSIFVEGAVARPGAYEMQGDTNVLKVLSMAGGIVYETSKQGIEVYRETYAGETRVYKVNYNKIRVDPESDIILQEGDIVVVHHSSAKRGLAGIWRGISGIFRVAL